MTQILNSEIMFTYNYQVISHIILLRAAING